MAPKTLLVVAALLLDSQGRVLLTQRRPNSHMGLCWEFPGGKVDPDETPETALIRELQEEIGLTVSDLVPWAFASHPYPTFHLLMPVFHCRTWHGAPQPLEVNAVDWFRSDQLAALPFPPADLPLVERLRQESANR